MSKAVTKAEVAQWVRRVREDLRDLESSLREGNWDDVLEMSMDGSGALCEITTMAQVMLGEPDPTETYVAP